MDDNADSKFFPPHCAIKEKKSFSAGEIAQTLRLLGLQPKI